MWDSTEETVRKVQEVVARGCDEWTARRCVDVVDQAQEGGVVSRADAAWVDEVHRDGSQSGEW